MISSLFAGPDALVENGRTKEREEKRQEPSNAPSEAHDFRSLQLDPLIVSHLASEKIKIVKPMGIQRTALPFLLSPSALQQDALIHSQTGSGKTLAYLLPILQSLLPFCQASWIDRSCLGTLAIILAPTRELAKQIYDVAELLCSLPLTDRSKGASEGEESEVRRTRWIVPGLLSGGATKNHEKSRLRKGLPLIVATPGRLLDHLRNTASLDVGRLQWLVLDEADRLLQLGFEETLRDIVKAIDGRRRAACDVQRQRMRDELGNQYRGEEMKDTDVIDQFGEAWWKYGRRTVLCSATLDEDIQVLAGNNLRNAKVIRTSITADKDMIQDSMSKDQSTQSVAAPSQLSQNYVVAPTKQRLIILIGLIRRALAKTGSSSDKATKIMVFLSCTDSVDFHLAALSGMTMARDATYDDDQDKDADKIEHSSQLFPSTKLFKLHGSLTAQARQTSLKRFAQATQPAVLFCTSVASRGLDLHVSLVIQVDAPTEKGADEYVHRVGRTARAGQRGESWLIVLPSEEQCVAHYQQAIRGGAGGSEAGPDATAAANDIVKREPVNILREGFGGADLVDTQTRATDAQMALERWVAGNESNADLARRAYLSHLRAYATHPPSERAMFAVSSLQLGHLAKAFALREAPAAIRAKVVQSRKAAAQSTAKTASESNKRKRPANNGDLTGDHDATALATADSSDEDDTLARTSAKLQFQRNEDTEARMYAKVRQLGKLHKRGGVLADYGGASEFQIG